MQDAKGDRRCADAAEGDELEENEMCGLRT